MPPDGRLEKKSSRKIRRTHPQHVHRCRGLFTEAEANRWQGTSAIRWDSCAHSSRFCTRENQGCSHALFYFLFKKQHILRESRSGRRETPPPPIESRKKKRTRRISSSRPLAARPAQARKPRPDWRHQIPTGFRRCFFFGAKTLRS